VNPILTSLDQIIAAKREALARRKSRTPIDAVRALASMQKRPQPILSTVTEDRAVMLIGHIRYALDADGAYDPVALALRFMREGVDAVSLFTDEAIYDGGLNDLTLVARAVRFPVISQDYIFDEYQVVEARAAGASALMLHAGVVEPASLWSLVSAVQRNRMTAIIHVKNREQLDRALTLAPQVVALDGDLAHGLDALCQMRAAIPRPTHVLLAQPLETAADAAAAAQPDAVLISPALIRQLGGAEQVRAAFAPRPSNRSTL
jgi:indole-3-glycerol phosphate synthase